MPAFLSIRNFSSLILWMAFSGIYVLPVYSQLFSLGSSNSYAHSASSNIKGIALDASGHAHVVGYTYSPAFPCKNAYQSRLSGKVDTFVAGFSSCGSELLYATYLGGTGEDRAFGIAIDGEDGAVICGVTSSPDFPIRGAYQSEPGGKLDAFVACISSSGSEVLYATYLGGEEDDGAFDVVVNSDGDSYVSGETLSGNFPTKNPYQPSKVGWEQDLFLVCFNPDHSELISSTYLGGSGVDCGGKIGLDPTGNIYIAGSTWSEDFPVEAAYSSKKSGKYDAFVSKFDPSASVLLYSTYLGGKEIDLVNDLAVDPERGGASITGTTWSTDFPDVSPLFERHEESGTAFVTSISPSGSSLSLSTCWGNPGCSQGFVIDIDRKGGIYIAGLLYEPDVPLINPFQSREGGDGDIFIAKLSPSTSSIVYSTFLGGNEIELPYGLAADSSGCLYVAGFTRSFDFPVKHPLQRNMTGDSDAFITKFIPSGSGLLYSTFLGACPSNDL